jgi:hypothetical protein
LRRRNEETRVKKRKRKKKVRKSKEKKKKRRKKEKKRELFTKWATEGVLKGYQVQKMSDYEKKMSY